MTIFGDRNRQGVYREDQIEKRTNHPGSPSDANRPWEQIGEPTPPPPREGEKGEK